MVAAAILKNPTTPVVDFNGQTVVKVKGKGFPILDAKRWAELIPVYRQSARR